VTQTNHVTIRLVVGDIL